MSTDIIPPWARDADRALGQAAGKVRVLSAATPQNLAAELARLEDAWGRGDHTPARFAYAPRPAMDDLMRGLLTVAKALEGEGPLGVIYAERARELESEAAIVSAVGTAAVLDPVGQRYARRDVYDGEADALAEGWIEPVGREKASAEARVRSDDEMDPRSLVSQLSRAIGARRIAFRIVVLREMAPLAAVGDGVVQVAGGRMLSERDTRRTVLHEIEGHVMPSERAKGLSLGIFAFGTARGSDDQEGRALSIERREGFLEGARRVELARRHVAARSVERGADLVESVRLLLARGAPLPDALRIAARVHRGGGIARERVYLPALLRVEAALRDDPSLDDVLAAGRVSVEAAPVLASWALPSA